MTSSEEEDEQWLLAAKAREMQAIFLLRKHEDTNKFSVLWDVTSVTSDIPAARLFSKLNDW